MGPSSHLVGLARYAGPTDASRRLVASGHTSSPTQRPLGRLPSLLVGLARYAGPTDVPPQAHRQPRIFHRPRHHHAPPSSSKHPLGARTHTVSTLTHTPYILLTFINLVWGYTVTTYKRTGPDKNNIVFPNILCLPI